MDTVKAYLMCEVLELLGYIAENDADFCLRSGDGLEVLQGAMSALIEGLLKEWVAKEKEELLEKEKTNG